MSYEETTGDLNTSVGELANLMNDTFTCCMRNYEALLPYFEKNDTTPKIYRRLVHVNILLNKLNEELVGLRVDYLTLSSYEQKGEPVLSEGTRKRRGSEVSRSGAKSIKTEIPVSSNTEFSVTLFSETGISKHSGNFVSVDTEGTKHTNVQKSDVHCAKNIKSEVHDSDEVVDLVEFTAGSSYTPTVQTACDTINNGMTVHIAGDEKNACVLGRLVGGNACAKPADKITQNKSNEECVRLQNVNSETRKQKECESGGGGDSKDYDIHRGLQGEVSCKTSVSCQAETPFDDKKSPVAFTTSDTESAMLVKERKISCNKGEKGAPHSPRRDERADIPVQRGEELCDRELDQYGVIRHKKGQFKCTVCDCILCTKYAVYDHLKGKKHKKKLVTAKNSSAKGPGIFQSSFESTSTASVSVCSAVACSRTDFVPSNSCESTASIPVCSAVSCSLLNTVPNNGCESIESVSVYSDVSCSLADTTTIVENTHQIISTKHAVRLDDIWTYFHAPFHINKKFFRIHSGKVVCSLCNEKIERDLLGVKTHISKLSHLNRITVLQNIELANKSSSKQMLNIPGILNNIIPRTQFSLTDNGFFCSVCKCFCENTIVLSHMTGASHGEKLEEMRKSMESKMEATRARKKRKRGLHHLRAIQNCHQQARV
ncbi:uncharacterized protein LOC126336310 isoform X1 [Schistocerca gregaria]|uniref:uncharacterized protein LOC126336310 isoform X1 n=1 Tax=Schistocerca gregaria TaxID=7010 RepID=UPI00211EDE23|nr:uncharacterized protein LOC126336310 isoform X1 [Schistocerca gregaria]XP_049855822.1 uncharacterized protein LOC126336310 isoform X1 [Schistocerca gregaria]XP_049855832.1 uncharacterized protein LOC126336310 isoform X1 [Schistocerca gregaria]XP_049855840.1 uncharacterized protein LOC126336310 isoform X1 [Schistocerca gregaria]XP_049855848.1 uncharacterized protein LOC126336310 isoform X1 [Schistocerca gregaria]XP_049855855.1 uncharacterized protein LOC126336310 isoform X1 [Schistocerca gre